MTVKNLLGQRILVKKLPEEIRKTEAGIELIAATQPNKGVIFKIAKEVNYELGKKGEEPLNEGDTIVYDKNDFPILTSDDKDYELITVHAVICVI